MTVQITKGGVEYSVSVKTLGISFDDNSASCVFDVENAGSWDSGNTRRAESFSTNELMSAYSLMTNKPVAISVFRNICVSLAEKCAWLKHDDSNQQEE